MDEIVPACDLLVVGGGASGLAAAMAGARLGLDVRLLEKTDRFGHKLALTGGGRCNFTHEDPPRTMAGRFDADSRLLVPLLRRFPFQRVVELFRSIGVRSKVDESGCVWPSETDGAGLRDALVRAATGAGAELLTGRRAVEVGRAGRAWEVRLEAGVARGRNLLLATGGASYPQTGSTGEGLDICRAVGLEVADWFPALCSLRPDRPVEHLAGNARPHVGMVLEIDGDAFRRVEGHFLFAREYISGSAILNLSGYAARALAAGRQAELVVDWVPERDEGELRVTLAAPGRRRLANALAPLVSRRFALDLVRRCAIPAERRVSELTRKEREAVIGELKRTRFRITGTEPLERATVCGGGLSLDEVDPATCRVRGQGGLHVTGELLDPWAETGGYNLHFAWATGIAAAEAVAGRELR